MRKRAFPTETVESNTARNKNKMRTSKIISAITLVSLFLIVSSLEAQLQAVALACQTEEINRDDEVNANNDDLTCSLDPSSAGGDCPRSAASDAYGRRSDYRSGDAAARTNTVETHNRVIHEENTP